MISSFFSNEKEFAKLTEEMQAIRHRLDEIQAMIVTKSIKLEAAISMMLEKESLTQTSTMN